MSKNILRAMPAEDWRTLERLIKSLRAGVRPGSITATRRGGRSDTSRPRTMAKITVVGDEGVYEAKEVIWDTEAAEWVEIEGGLAWVEDLESTDPQAVGPLREQGGSAGAAVDDVVEARLGPTVNTDDDSTDYAWFFGLGGGGLMPYALDRVGIRGGNRLRARPAKLDGGTLVPDVGADVVEIARPWKLRHGLAFNTNLISFTTLPGDIDRALVAAEINGTTTSETWEVSPPYVENDIIWASPAQTGIAGVGLIDLNLDARAWIAVG